MAVFTRKVTTDTVVKYLKRFGVPAHAIEQPGQAQGVVIAPLDVFGQVYMLAIDPIVETGQLDFVVMNVLHASLDDTPADRVHGLLLAMAALNYRIPLARLAYDPRDGEIALKYGIPVLGGELHYEDFERVLVVLQNILAKHAPDLRAVVAGEKTSREILE
jgi:hypothetical protein